MLKRTVIGIDTGTKTGFALINSHGQLCQVQTLKIHEAMQRVSCAVAQLDCSVWVRVEDARKRKWLGNAGRERLQGAGSIKRDAVIWEDFLTDLQVQYPDKLTFEMVAPAQNKTKLNAKEFARITGWQERTSEHGRDAAMLVFGAT